METIKSLGYKGMAITHIRKGELLEKTKLFLLKKKDGGKGVMEDSGLTLVAFVFIAALLTFGNKFLQDLLNGLSTKVSSWMGGI